MMPKIFHVGLSGIVGEMQSYGEEKGIGAESLFPRPPASLLISIPPQAVKSVPAPFG